MADKNAKQLRFVEQRARALAVMYLTRREDLTVEEARETDLGYDLLVRTRPDKNAGLREFAVQLKGVWEALTEETVNQAVRPAVRQMKRRGPLPFPVVLFVFTMEVTRAWYTWIAEPVVSPDGSPTLQMHGEADCKPLDNDALAEIVDAVNRWYDAFYLALTTAGKGRDNGASGDGR